MDIDVFVAAHTATWARLDHLVRRAARPRRCTGAELDELVDLYQRVATHLSVIRTSSPDPALVDRLSSLVARARGAVAGAKPRTWQNVWRFVAVTFPAAVWRARHWTLAVAAGFLFVAFAVGTWVAQNPDVQAAMIPPEAVRDLVEHRFADYYSSAPAASFGSHVFVNNAFVATIAFAFGPLLGVPTLWILFTNALNVGGMGGIMVANGKGDVFFGLILPHGLLELTAVFVAAAVGMRIGWTLVDPGDRSRADALAEEGRSSALVILGLVGVFAVAGFIESVVTPSGLPTWGRVGIGIAVEAGFVTYVTVLGRRAALAGETGDLATELRGDVLPRA